MSYPAIAQLLDEAVEQESMGRENEMVAQRITDPKRRQICEANAVKHYRKAELIASIIAELCASRRVV